MFPRAILVAGAADCAVSTVAKSNPRDEQHRAFDYVDGVGMSGPTTAAYKTYCKITSKWDYYKST